MNDNIQFMKKIILTVALATLSLGIFAQAQDSLLRRQMELEREFNPTLRNADKINSLPTLGKPNVKKANTNYSNWSGRVTPPIEIALSKPADIMTQIPYSSQRGYLFFNAGNYTNINGAFGYRIIDDEKNNLAFSFHHNSTNGEIKYNQTDYSPDRNTATMMDNYGALNFNHKAEQVMVGLKLSYLHSMFNYYGNPFGNEWYYDNDKKNYGVINARFITESIKSNVFNYKGYIDIKNFTTKMSDIAEYDWMKGNEIEAMVGLDKPYMGGNNTIGLDAKVNTTFYDGDAKDYFLLNASPYFGFSGDGWNAKLGADLLYQNSNKSEFRVVPNVDANLNISDNSSIYVKVHGGFAPNTLTNVMAESRYILSPNPLKASFSIVDIEGGLNIGSLPGFRFNLFGGYVKTDDEHFLVLNGNESETPEEVGVFKESLKPIYGTLTHSHIGGMLETNIWAPLNVSMKVKKNFYDVKDIKFKDVDISDPKAYNMPGLELSADATLEIIDNLKLMLNYYLASERWSYMDGVNIKMDNINDLSLGGTYTINNSFSVNVRANNLLSQRYDIFYGYPAQGINVMGGFTFKF